VPTRVTLAAGLAGAALLLVAVHARRALGPLRAAAELAALTLYLLIAGGLAAEGARRAGPVAGLAAMATAVAVTVACMSLAARLWWLSMMGRSLSAALLGSAVALGVAPTAVRAGLWPAPAAGAFLGAPIASAAAVFVAVFAWTAAAELGGGTGALGRRAQVIVGGLALLGSLGWVSSRWRVEDALTLGAAWTVWSLLWGVPAVLALTGRAALLPESLAGLLGAGGSGRPAAVLMLVLGATLAAAAVLGDPLLAVAAAGPLLPPLALLSARPPLDGWRGRAFARLGEVQDFAAVLMKPRNGTPWTAEDRAFLRAGVRTLGRWTPGFLLFLLPGGFVLLGLYAWLLDRRRSRAQEAASRRRASDAAA